MYNLISEVREQITADEYLVETIKDLFNGDEHAEEYATALHEGVQQWLGTAIAMANAGKNPFENGVDPDVLTSVVMLADPEVRQAFNWSPAKFAMVDHVDRSEKVRRFLKHASGEEQMGAGAPTRQGTAAPAATVSGRNKKEGLMKLASENPKALGRLLSKAQQSYIGAFQQHQQAAQRVA